MDQERRRLLTLRLQAQASNGPILDVRDLIDAMIDDTMQKLTTAEVPTLYKHQGRISALKDLKAVLSPIKE